MKFIASFALAVMLAGFVAPIPALAHNSLISSDPANEAKVESSPQAINLTFDQPVQPGEQFNTITVIGPGNTTWDTNSQPNITDNSVSFPIRPLGPAGEYQVNYRVLSADGHPVNGTLKFSLTTAGQGTPATALPNQSANDSQPENGGIPFWIWLAGALVLLGVGVVIALRGGKSDQP
jgi:copper resistance protein C